MKALSTGPNTKQNQAQKWFRLIYGGALIAGMVLIMLSPWNSSARERIEVITIHAKRYEFAPAEITLIAGKPVKLVFIADDVGHGISVEGLLSDLNFDPGEAATAIITPPKPGDFAGGCSRYCGTGHRGMTFIIHVKEPGA